MKKFLIFILVIVIVLGIWSYLSRTPNLLYNESNKNDKETIINLNQGIKEVNIYKSDGFGKKGSDLIISYTDRKNIELFKNIVKNVKKLEGIVDMSDPNYIVEIIYDDNSKDQLYAWITENGINSIMNIKDTHTLYNFPENMNEELIDLFKEELIKDI